MWRGWGWDGDFCGGLLVWVGRVILGLDLDLVFVFVLGLVFVWIVDGFGFGFGGLDCVWFWDCFCLDTGYRIPDTGGLLYILCIDKHTQKSIKSNT